MKLKEIGEVWNSASRLLSDFIGLLSSKILLPWQRDEATSPLYSQNELFREVLISEISLLMEVGGLRPNGVSFSGFRYMKG